MIDVKGLLIGLCFISIPVIIGPLLLFCKSFRERLAQKFERDGRKYTYAWKERFDTEDKIKKWRKQLRIILKYLGLFFTLFGLFVLAYLLKLFLLENNI